MPFKTILAIIQSTEDAERVSDCAGALAARYEAHLIGLHAEALPIPYTSTIGFPDAEFIQASTEVNQERSKKIEALFRKRTADAGDRRRMAQPGKLLGRQRPFRHCQRPELRPRRRRPGRIGRRLAPMSTRCSTMPAGRCSSPRMTRPASPRSAA